MPACLRIKTEVCREHVDAGHRCREHAGAAVVCVTDVEHGMGEHDVMYKYLLYCIPFNSQYLIVTCYLL